MSPDPAALDPARLYDGYRRAIGRPRDAIPTPALILDLDVARRNLAAMRDRLEGRPARLRPHIKIEKCPDLARLHVEYGAVGIATATAWEALVMARAGIADVLVANEVVGPAKVDALVEAARHCRLTVTVDDPVNVADLAAAAVAGGVTMEMLIEVDVGMGRGGTRSIAETLTVAAAIAAAPGVALRGVQAYEGHCMLEPDRDVRIAGAHAAMALAAEHVEQLRAAGHEVHDVSGGGTGTYDITSANPIVTELQAGTFVFMDLFHGTLVQGFEHSLTVAATVVIRHGSTVVLDAGRKSIGIDFVQPRMVGYDLEARYFAEEHALFDFPGEPPLDLGDRVELLPGYAATTVNMYDVYHVVSEGVVVDIWPIVPRGPGMGLAQV
jgi:D-serine deaminase-like pyridoxal phosphate-dependent protein